MSSKNKPHGILFQSPSSTYSFIESLHAPSNRKSCAGSKRYLHWLTRLKSATQKPKRTLTSSPNRFSPKPSAANSFLKIQTTNQRQNFSNELLACRASTTEMNVDPFGKLKSHGDFAERHSADRIEKAIPS